MIKISWPERHPSPRQKAAELWLGFFPSSREVHSFTLTLFQKVGKEKCNYETHNDLDYSQSSKICLQEIMERIREIRTAVYHHEGHSFGHYKKNCHDKHG